MYIWEIESSLEKWEEISGKIEYILEKQNFSTNFIVSVLLATDELFTNISRYAYGEKTGMVNVCAEIDGATGKCEITFSDYGMKFNPLEYTDKPYIDENNPHRIKPGGWGIFMAKQQVDELKYENVDGMNRLTLIKRECV